MAKVKKKKLSLEELLEQALVKGEDKPYEVPSNWIWTKLANISEVIMGQSPSGSDTTDDAGYTPLIGGAADMGLLYPNVKRYTMKPTKVSKLGDVIVSIRATLGRPIFSDGEYCLGRGVCSVRSSVIEKKLIRYFFLIFENYLYTVSTGTTFAQVSKRDIENMLFPFPPYAEQQRIVEVIESLFEKLDKAKELVQSALDSFENRKVILLERAIRGYLTEKWRKNNPKHSASNELKDISTNRIYKKGINNTIEFDIPETWVWISLGDIIDLLSDYHANGSYEVLKEHVELLDEPSYACMIRTTNFEKNNFDTLMKYITKEAYEFMEKSKLFGNEILINKIGNAGSVYLMPNLQRPASLAMNLFMLRLSEKISSKYVYYHLLTGFSAKDIKQFVRGVTTKSVDKKSINSLKIALPPIEEQKEIVRILNNLLSNEKRAKELCDIIEKIDLMKKSILARAFRGELGTNDPKEESALELLKQVLKEKI